MSFVRFLAFGLTTLIVSYAHAEAACAPNSTIRECYEIGIAEVGKALAAVKAQEDTLDKQAQTIADLEAKIARLTTAIQALDPKVQSTQTRIDDLASSWGRMHIACTHTQFSGQSGFCPPNQALASCSAGSNISSFAYINSPYGETCDAGQSAGGASQWVRVTCCHLEN